VALGKLPRGAIAFGISWGRSDPRQAAGASPWSSAPSGYHGGVVVFAVVFGAFAVMISWGPNERP
jgi:hypothetical protein